jgi:hypothetical protein
VRQQQPSGFGKGHRAWPARPLEQALPDDPLEHRDLLADR